MYGYNNLYLSYYTLQPHSGPACGLAPTPLPYSSPLKLSTFVKSRNGVKQTTLGQNGYVKVH